MSANGTAQRPPKPIPTPAAGAAPPAAPTSRARDLAREHARRAWEWVDEAAKRPDLSDTYGTLARKLASYLQVSGLGQTMAFLYSKGSSASAHRLLFGQLAGQLTRGRGGDRRDMQDILDLEPGAYRRATGDAMALALWLKRFAEGRLGEARQ